eukprot:11190185-Lingulodinium_polyedra.AAC.1
MGTAPPFGPVAACGAAEVVWDGEPPEAAAAPLAAAGRGVWQRRRAGREAQLPAQPRWPQTQSEPLRGLGPTTAST